MSAFPNWEEFAVFQRRPNSGCVPTGYEMLLRAAKVANIDYDKFQDEFDLDKDRSPQDKPLNNFESVGKAVHLKYSHVQFKRVVFPPTHGEDKLRFIEKRINAQQPVLVSLSLAPFGHGGWHIMPVVDATEEELILLAQVDKDGTKHTKTLKKNDLVTIHNEFAGGDDVAYLEVEQSQIVPDS